MEVHVVLSCYIYFSGAEMLASEGGTGISKIQRVPVLGFLQSQAKEKSGRIVIYGDSNCLDNSHLTKGNKTLLVIEEFNIVANSEHSCLSVVKFFRVGLPIV